MHTAVKLWRNSSNVGKSLEILKSWIDLIDDDGWVGREQILGEEARSKVNQSALVLSSRLVLNELCTP